MKTANTVLRQIYKIAPLDQSVVVMLRGVNLLQESSFWIAVDQS